jgi:hypothetical protein
MIDFKAKYQVKGYEGVAFRIVRFSTNWVEGTLVWEEGEEDEIFEFWTEGEEVEDTSIVVGVMVGDDHEMLIDVENLVKLGEEDYCTGCGATDHKWC